MASASTRPALRLASTGNRLALYADGDEAFAAAYDSIRQARRRVWLETYILEPDEVGQLAVEALAEAAARGCDVLLLYDRWGSPRFGARHTAPILEAGGRVAVYNPLLPWRKIGRKVATFFHRDHRKILVADDVGFCGGRNLSVEYGGPGPERFYDHTLRLEGPAVRDLAIIIASSFQRATGRGLTIHRAPEPVPGGVSAEVLLLDERSRVRDLDRRILALLEEARRHAFVFTPYFIPPRPLQEALQRAAARGVDVRVLTAGLSDVPQARTAGRHLYGELLRHGLRIFEMQEPVLHAKALTIDGAWSLVGSYNLDRYGSRHNLEIGVASPASALARALETEFHACLARSLEITLDAWQATPWPTRLTQWGLFHLSRI